MNRYISLLLTFVLVTALLSGCVSSDNPQNTVSTTPTAQLQTTVTAAPTEFVAPPTVPKGPRQVEHTWTALSIDEMTGWADQIEGNYLVIKSVETLQVLKELQIAEYPDEKGRYEDRLQVYNNAFFENNTLIVVPWFSAYSEPTECRAVELIMNIDGSFLLNLTIKPQYVCAYCRGYGLVFIEVGADFPENAAIDVDIHGLYNGPIL